MKLALQYLIMVVCVLAVLLGVLRLGQGLTAPAAIQGQWRLAALPESTCSDLVTWSDPTLMLIAQSGLYLDIQLGGEEGLRQSGRLDGMQLSSTGTAQLYLTLDRQAEPHSLEGELRLPECSALEVRYIQQPAQEQTSQGAH